MKPGKTVFRATYLYIVALAIIAAIALITPPSALAAGPVFTDLPESDPAYPFVNYLVKTNQIQGYPDGSFRPAGSITRAEAAALLVRAAKLDMQEPTTGQTYTDLDPSHWAYPVVQTAARAGLIQGYPDQTYRPEAPVTRAEACALLLRLTSMPLPEDTTLDQTITDIEPAHWARQQIAVALQAGLFTIAQKNSFAPEAQATRAQFARGLATILNIDPERNKTTLTGTLTPIKGKTTISKPGQSPQEITVPTACEAGVTIETGPDSRAELNFADGSGLRLDSSTSLTIIEARGQTTILKDGTPGTVIDNLKLELTRGRLYGALASTYINKKTPGKTAGAENIQLAYATKELPPGLIIAEGETDSQDLQWWQAAFEEKVRVEVDMPWGVASIRGTFWMNQVGAGGNITSVADGHVEVVSRGGQHVSLTPGQSTSITSPSAPPTQPAPMTAEEQQAWEEAKDWVNERATTIEQTAPVVTPPTPVEQQEGEQLPGQQPENPGQTTQSIGESIINSVSQATSGGGSQNAGTTPATPSSGGSGSSNDTGPKEKQDIPPGYLTTDLVKTFNGGDVTITIPSGTTLGDGAAITVQKYKDLSHLPEGADMAGQAADISITGVPSGTTITIGLKCIPGKEKVAIYYYNPGTRAWEYQNSVLDTNNWFVTASVQHFSLYAVLEDNTPPTIKSIKPYDKATSVPVDQAITITFSENIVPGENYYDLFLRGGSQNISLSGSIDGKTLTLKPLQYLDYNATYTLDLPAGLVKDGIGNSMAEGLTISFTTCDTGANLKSLVLSAGALSPAFSSGVKSYTAEVENSVESVTLTAAAADPGATIKINGTTTASGTQSAPVTISNEGTTITIEVTAKDGKAVKTYTVTVTRAGNAELSSLAISPGELSLAISPGVTSYTTEVGSNVESITLTAATADPEATIKINGATTASGVQSVPITISNESITITIEVTAKNGKTVKTYTITVARAGNADLSSLSISAGRLSPAFNPTTTSYSVEVDSSVTSVTVTATAAGPGAMIKINGTATASGTASAPVAVGSGETAITIEVTAKDGKTVKTYTVTITRAGSAELSSLALSAGVLDPAFSPGVTSYATEVEHDVESVTVTAATADPEAAVKVNGVATAIGVPSAPVAVGSGETTITIEVTAKDGKTVKTYTVTITRASSAELSSLALSAGSLSPAFNPATTSYNAEVGNSVSIVTVTATAAETGAMIVVNGTIVASSVSATVSLSEGANKITVSVTAQGGNASKVYTITVTRAAAPVQPPSGGGDGGSSQTSRTITGTVYLPSTAASNVYVTVRARANSVVLSSQGVTIPAGSSSAVYTLTIPAAAVSYSYLVEYYVQNGYVQVGYYSTGRTTAYSDEATTVSVSSGSKSGINLTLIAGHAISGTILLPQGGPDVQVVVSAVQNSRPFSWGTNVNTASNADYTIYVPANAPGYGYQVKYYIKPENMPAGSGYVQQGYYSNGATTAYYNYASLVDMSSGDRPDIDLELIQGGEISGEVWLPDLDNDEVPEEAPAGGIAVLIYAQRDPNEWWWWTQVEIPEGESSANYSLNVPVSQDEETYRVSYEQTSYSSYAQRGYFRLDDDTTADYGLAYRFGVSGEGRGGIDLTLLTGYTISGKVSLPEGQAVSDINVRVEALLDEYSPPLGWEDVVIQQGQEYTNYNLVVPAASGYRVRYTVNTAGSGYVQQGYYSTNGCVTNFYDPYTAVNVTEGNVGGKNLTLLTGSTISGTVYLPDGATATGNIYVTVYANKIETTYTVTASLTIPNGGNSVNYSLGVPEGNYIVYYCLPYPAEGYVTCGYYYYSSGGTTANYEDTPVSTGSIGIQGIDLELIPGCVITGTVSLPSGLVADEDIYVAVVALKPQEELSFSTEVIIPEGGDYASYNLIVPRESVYYLMYNLYEPDYLHEGYYHSDGTTMPDIPDDPNIVASSGYVQAGLHLIPVVATFSGAVYVKEANELILTGLIGIPLNSISGLTYSDAEFENHEYQLVGNYVPVENEYELEPGNYYYNSDENTLMIILTGLDAAGIEELQGFALNGTETDTVSALEGWYYIDGVTPASAVSAVDVTQDYSAISVEPSSNTPIKNEEFYLDITGAKDAGGYSLDAVDKDVHITGSIIDQWITGVTFANGAASVPITLEETGPATLMVKIEGVTAPGIVNVTVIDTPTVTTNPATGLGTDVATLEGSITDNGESDITEYGFYWGIDPVPLTKVTVGTDNHVGSFSSGLADLAANTTYCFKAFATNEVGTVYGEVVSFKTLPSPPAIVSITAYDTGSATGLNNGDTIKIVFDVDTNHPAVNNKAAVDNLINFNGKSFGNNYSGTWNDYKTLVLTVSDATGGTLDVGDTITIKVSGNLKTLDGLSPASDSGGVISGSF